MSTSTPDDAAELPVVIHNRFADGTVLEVRSSRPLDSLTWHRLQATLSPHAPGSRPPTTLTSLAPSASSEPTPLPPEHQTFSQRVAAARMRAGLSQSALARCLDVAPQTIQALESGRATRTHLVVPIARATNVSPDWLHDGAGPIDRPAALPAPPCLPSTD